MNAVPNTETIAIDELRVGMFVHLDMGWMAHPFPLGSFRIGSATQLATIRTLGVPRVRWSPAQSDPPDPPEAPLAAPARSAPAAHATPRAANDAGAPPAPDTSPQQRALAAQHAALARCERQYAEAARGCHELAQTLARRPGQARAHAEALAKSLVDKMLGAGDLCVRLLADAAGDKAALHALNVTIISLLMGRSFGLDEADMLDLGVGAMLHDIGKLDLAEGVRHRDDRFSASEQRAYEEHVAAGIAQARRLGLSAGATLVIAQHHEHADGSGFPLRLNTDRMTAGARIVALVNRYDRLCNPHLAARALTPHEAVARLFAQGQTTFDTAILGAFIRMMGVYPAGSTVQLTDDRYALVVGVNASQPLKPRVLVHEAGAARDAALIVDLEAMQHLGILRSIKPALLPPPVRAALAPRPRVACFFEPSAGPGVA